MFLAFCGKMSKKDRYKVVNECVEFILGSCEIMSLKNYSYTLFKVSVNKYTIDFCFLKESVNNF